MYKILVVDDEPKIREVIKEYGEFPSLGFSTIFFGSSKKR